MNSVFLFRLSASVLVIGVEFLACLVGKLIKERSLVLYNYFYSFCTGILLANGLSWFLFQGVLSKLTTSSTSFTMFSLSMITLLSFHINDKSSHYEYEKVVGLEDEGDDDEDLGIELTESNHNLHSAHFDLEVEARRKRKATTSTNSSTNTSSSASSTSDIQSTAIDPDESFRQNERWQRIVLTGLVVMEVTKGIILASEEHASLSVFMNVFFVGILQALSFGVFCEESIASPSVYIRSILMLVTALPVGMIISILLPLESDGAYRFAASVNCFICGIFTASTICYMVPMNDLLSTALFASVGTKDRVGILRFKAFLFVVGYALAAMSAWI